MSADKEEDDYFEKRSKKERLVASLIQGDSKTIFEAYDLDRDFHEPLLVWIRPSRDLIKFLDDQLSAVGISKLLSVGCGCGFLERLIDLTSTALSVSGLEVNSGWWESKYSTPHFIPLDYTEPGLIPTLPEDAALMFCYFNNGDCFNEYLKAFSGNVVILIGPVDGQRHCDPEPYFLRDFNDSRWRLTATHDIRGEGRDHVAVYLRH